MNTELLNRELRGKSAEEIVAYFISNHTGKIGLASSLSLEDQVLTDMVRAIDPKGTGCRVFTLDTGRLFPETYSLIEKTNAHYDTKIEVMFPDHTLVESMVKESGVNLFYLSIEKRRECCHIRKIEPLKRAFDGLDVWICGLRREQSVTRAEMQVVEWDGSNNMLKINPLIEWSEAQTIDYIKEKGIPYNALHDKNFPSIGCQPCTRAVNQGEDIRAGRWWWENPDQKECGLHK